MLFDLGSNCDLTNDADVLVVGSGAVGLSLAADLARSGIRVLLLEAGGRTLDASSQALFETASSIGHPLGGLHFGRYRMLGGTTNFWAGQLVAVDDIAFEARSWIGETGWPVTGQELAPAIRRAYDLIGLKDALHDEGVWPQMGVEPPKPRDDIEFFFTRWTPESNFFRLFREEILHSANLKVILNAPVVALASEGQNISGVVVKHRGGEQIVRAKIIVLANGTIEIARLLMLPLHGGALPPWNDNKWLGRSFVEHLDTTAGNVSVLDDERFHLIFDSILIEKIKYSLKLKLTPSAQRKHGMMGIAGHFIYNSTIKEQINHMKKIGRRLISGSFDWSLFQDPGLVFRSAPMAFPLLLRYLKYRRTYNPSDGGVQFRLTCEQMPEAESRIRLSGESDALGVPTVEVDWRINGGELETMARFSEQVGHFLESEGLAKLSINPLLQARDRAFISSFEDAFHHMGTTRMAATRDDGVVDSSLKVFDADNLYVAGSAVFRSTGFANPTLTAIAMALRLSEHIRARLGNF